MLKKRKLRVGIVGLFHRNFRGDMAAQYGRSLKEMQDLSEKLGFELYAVKGGIITDDEGWAARRELEANNIDLLMIQSTAFNSGTLVPIFTKMNNVFIGFWGLPEPTREGPLLFNSFCAVNMNASIVGEYLREYDIPYKWFYGNCGDDLFINRFKVTVKALTALVNIRESRIALIGGIASGFDNQYFDERKLEKRFGARLFRNHEFSEVKDRALAYKTEEISGLMEQIIGSSCSIAPLAKEAMERNARVVKALNDIKSENKYDGIALGCWPKFRQELNMVACAAIGELNYEDAVTACEGDVYGLITMMAMRYMVDLPTLLMDLSDLDESDESILFWHCGIGCKNLAHEGRVWMEPHTNPAPMPGRGMVQAAPAAEMVFAKQEATAARFTKEGDELFLLTGEFNPEKKSFDGTRGWLGNLKLNDSPVKVRDLVNTIIVQQMQHHYALSSGNLAEEMLELACWLGTKPVEEVKYKNYLQMRNK